jgi:hypothetical protein
VVEGAGDTSRRIGDRASSLSFTKRLISPLDFPNDEHPTED